MSERELQFRDFERVKHGEMGPGKPLTARIGSAIIAGWIGQEAVRTYFQRRQV